MLANMTLSEEQKKMIQRNRERALEIRRKKLVDAKQNQDGASSAAAAAPLSDDGGQKRKATSSMTGTSVGKRRKREDSKNDSDNGKKRKDDNTKHDEKHNSDECSIELEEFEQGASSLVTKSEAMQMYCLPEGTLAVCSYVEKENPRRKGWNMMKLYDRSEIRRRARARFGGLDGLIEERTKRKMKRFQKDLEDTKDIFKSKG
mmetsp:Transcript_10867/g.16183  ORF Transcript_10867/g.16183 Transcript_10867/m.16183 type:complete len:203 (-) Transcript_10867:70-678(-)